MKVVWDESKWPLVVARFPASMNLKATEAFCQTWEEILNRRKAWVLVADGRLVKSMEAASRQTVSGFVKTHQEPLQRYLLADACIIESPLVAGFVTAIGWIMPWPFPLRFFTDFEKGVEWVKSKLPEHQGE